MFARSLLVAVFPPTTLTMFIDSANLYSLCILSLPLFDDANMGAWWALLQIFL